MATKLTTNYYWWLERNNINLVQDSEGGDFNYVTVDKTGLKIRLYAIRRATHFTNDLTEESELPNQFHEALAYKVIADMYRLPGNLNLQLAQYFDQMYQRELKQAKKYSRSTRVTSGVIKGVDF
jgi:hypothetical protein